MEHKEIILELEDDLKCFNHLTNFQQYLIAELRMINHSLNKISVTMNDNFDTNNWDGLNGICERMSESLTEINKKI